MNIEALFLFVILLLGLILCSFLGRKKSMFEGLTSGDFNGTNTRRDNNAYTGNNSNNTTSNTISNNTNRTNYDNYNHYDGSSIPTKFYGKDGAIVKLENNNGKYSIIETKSDGVSSTFTIEEESTTEGFTINGNEAFVRKYIGPNGASATIVNSDNGLAIKITDSDGNTRYYYEKDIYTYNPDFVNYGNNPPGYDRPGSRGPYNQPGYNPPGTGYNYGVNNPPGYDRPGSLGPYNQPGYNPPGTGNNYGVNNPPGYDRPGSYGPYNQPGYNPPGVGAPGVNYNDSLPQGIARSQIPKGQEDLYILKSEVVPPVCPACPQSSSCPREEPCPACPACARCPEPSFECKKVPNYNAGNDYLPVPVLNDFSTFGM